MANLDHLFKKFNQSIKLTDEKRNILMNSRDLLRDRMKINFMQIPYEQRGMMELYFQTQGSIIMDTIINPILEDYDLDDGVYFQGKLKPEERPLPSVFHTWVLNAVDKHNEYEKITDKPTCVRVKYKIGCHIDIPIYYADGYYSPDLAETVKGWTLSNPVEFIAWFEEKAGSGFQKAYLYEALKYKEPYEKWLTDIRKSDCQLRRLVRYMKAWADVKKSEMPCGIIMTILVAENFSLNQSDDVALRDTLVNIKKYLQQNGFRCPRPTSPVGEDLFASTSHKDMEYFKSALDSLIESANNAISSISEVNSCKEWSKHFGSRFPCHLAKVEVTPETNKQPNIKSLKRVAGTQQPWCPRKK